MQNRILLETYIFYYDQFWQKPNDILFFFY